MSLPSHHLDLNRPDFIADPYADLARLREETPIFYDETWNKVFFTRHADISALLRDKRLGRSILCWRALWAGCWRCGPPLCPRSCGFS